MLTNNCGRSLLAESGIVMSHGFLNLLTRVRHFNCCLLLCFELLHIREEYQGAPVLGNEELWRLSGTASLPH